MAKLTLEIEADYEFDLIGICSHIKDYRLSWEINQELKLNLSKDGNLELSQNGELQSHAFYSFLDEDNFIDYFLISNRSEKGMLIPEENKCDYFLLIKGLRKKQEINALQKEIASLKHVLTSYTIEVEELKSKNNLLF
ncbi:MAG: IPExxxVDY family protein [Vicingaceae bacterium]